MHLVIEKILKALYVKKNKSAPYAPKSHDLLYLAEKIELELTYEQEDLLDTFENDIIDGELNLMRLRRKIDTRIEPHLIRTKDYKNVVTPFIKEVIDTGIKVA